MDFSYYYGALFAGFILSCSGLAHAIGPLAFVANYAVPMGLGDENVGTCERNFAALVSSLQETALLENQELSVDSRSNGKTLLHYEDFLQVMWCQDGEMHIDIE